MGNEKFVRSGSGMRWRNVLVAAVASVATLWSSVAMATITQGDFSVFGFFESRESGRWGEGSSNNNATPTTGFASGAPTPGTPATENGGSFDFNHWDLVQMRQLADVRPDYHMVKDYKAFGRFDTLILKDADFFAYYRPWYDATGSIKDKGRAEANRSIQTYNQQELQAEYFRNDLREWYGQLNFTDNFSMRVGKQQVIWTEADALSGTEVTNPVDTRFHGVYGAETPEDTRRNVRMVKFNYILPDFMKTSNNEIDAFWIPGDYEGDTIIPQTDPRNPWVIPVSLAAGLPGSTTPPFYNQNGQPIRVMSNGDYTTKPQIFVAGLGFADLKTINISHTPSNSLENSEFGVRLSTLLPVGDGLQASFIYLYEARNSREVACTNCSLADASRAFPAATALNTLPVHGLAPGGFIVIGVPSYGKKGLGPLFGPGTEKFGTFLALSETNYRRNQFFGLTGTYYDKDLTGIVWRYDTLYTPTVPVGVFYNASTLPNQLAEPTGSAWTQMTRFILAGDRPTYIPWISKQHTFITFQYVNTWFPDRPNNAKQAPPVQGKFREDTNVAFINFTNWVMNGQLTTGNLFFWDIDNNVGYFGSTNSYRYSRNVLFGVNVFWAMGRSGRTTDPLLLSREQRYNELEFTLTYEI
jgi:hypothetical protein